MYAFQSIREETAPVIMLNDKGYKINEYKTIAKTKLYTDISVSVITKLINSKHTKPFFWEKGNMYIYLRKKEDYEKNRNELRKNNKVSKQ